MTADAAGAQRVAWSPVWLHARSWFRQKLEELPVEIEVDEAANRWATLPGERAEALLIGGHLDSVPNGGWLDGCLGTLAGLEVLRRLCAGDRPPLTVKLVDWADEEGARFGGRSDSFGAATVAGTLDPTDLRGVRDAGGIAFEDALADCGVSLDEAQSARGRLEDARAYLELHIEQGPVLERLQLPLGVVTGTIGVERHGFCFGGETAHAGATPMDGRRDALAAAARFILATRELGIEAGAYTTTGQVSVQPNIPTAIVGHCEITLDQRHADFVTLGQLVEKACTIAEEVAADERVSVEWEQLWSIEPIDFDPDLVTLTEEVVEEVAGRAHRLSSGTLHDAAEVARAGVPTVMLFVQSLGGLSHTKEEDTLPEHIELAVDALDRLASKTLLRLAETSS